MIKIALILATLCSLYGAPDESAIGDIIGQAIWQGMFDTQEEKKVFIEGMMARENGEPALSHEAFDKLHGEFFGARKKWEMLQNLKIANVFLEDFKKRPNACECLPEVIYTETLSKGDGKTLESQDGEVILSLTVKDLNGELLYSKPSSLFLLSELEASLSYALLGIKEGEERSVFLHPLVLSQMDLSIYAGCIANVYLKEIIFQNKKPPIVPTIKNNGEVLENEQLIHDSYSSLKEKSHYAHGLKAWDYYKKTTRKCSFEEVLQGFRKAQNGELIDLSIPDTEKLLNDIHWEILKSSTKN